VPQHTSRSGPTPVASPRRRGVPRALHARAGLLVAGMVVLVAVLLISSVAAPQAQAKGILGTGISIPNPLSPILGGLSSGIVGLAVKAFEAIIKALFTPLAKFVTVALIGWLTAIPNFAQGHVAQLEHTVAAICGGVLGAVATISVIRYWLAGFVGGGDSGFSALEGLVRTIGAALFIAIWPWLFQKAIGLANLLSSSLLGSGTTVHDVAKLLEAGLAGTAVGSLSGIGLFLGIAIGVAASLLFLGLLLLKIVVSVSTILLFVGMPFAAVLWPITPWIARLVGRAFAVCLAVPVLWALSFATAGALMVDTLTLNQLTFSANGVLNTLLSPLVAIVLLYVMLKLPIHLSRVAMLGGAALGGGFVSRAVSYAAGSQMRGAAKQHMPDALGGRSDKSQSEGSTAGRLRRAATVAGAAASGGASAAAAGAGAARGATASSTAGASGAGGALGTAGTGAKTAAGSANGRAYAPPQTTGARGAALQNELQAPAYNEERHLGEIDHARARALGDPVTVDQAKGALQSLSAASQVGAKNLALEHGQGAQEHYAYQATGEWWPEERDAWRTLAAASPEVRAEALKDAPHDAPVGGGVDTSPTIGSGTGGAAGEPTVLEGHSTDPRPVSDSLSEGGGGDVGGGGAGETPASGQEATHAPDRDPWSVDPSAVDPSGGRPRPTPAEEPGATTTPPPASGRTNVRPPREPRDPNPGDLFRS
jgi:hypothetical protein